MRMTKRKRATLMNKLLNNFIVIGILFSFGGLDAAPKKRAQKGKNVQNSAVVESLEKAISKRFLRSAVKQYGEDSEVVAAYKAMYHLSGQMNPSAQPGTVLPSRVWNDLELFCGEADLPRNVFNSLNRGRLVAGAVALQEMMALPLTEVQALRARQEVVRAFATDDALYDSFSQELSCLGERDLEVNQFFLYSLTREQHWKDLIDPYVPESVAKKARVLPNMYRELDWKKCEFFGRLADAFVSSAMWGSVVSSLCSAFAIKKCITHKAAREILRTVLSKLSLAAKIGAGAAALLGGGLGYLFINGSRRAFKNRRELFYKLQDKMRAVGEYFDSARSLIAMVSNDPQLSAQVPEVNDVLYLVDETVEGPKEILKLVELLDSDAIRSQDSTRYFTTAMGKVIVAYNMMGQYKNKLAPLMVFLGKVDALVGVARLVRESQEWKQGFVFPEYIDGASAPEVSLTKLWNPLFNHEAAVASDFALGGARVERNAIISGVNAGGKSSSLRAITLNVVLAQTLCIAAAKSMILTPYSTIATYLTISDDAAMGRSRFKMEAVRALELIAQIESMPRDKFAFSIMDEVFNGTNPREGAAAAYSVALHLNALRNSTILLATHYPLLKKLEVHTGGQFKNFMVRAYTNPLSYPFELTPGFSEQNIAVDILREDGMHSHILDKAEDIIAHPEKYAVDKKLYNE